MRLTSGTLLSAIALLVIAGCGPRPEGTPDQTTSHPAANAPDSLPAGGNASESGVAPTGTAASGAKLFKEHCQGCHGDQGQGVKNVGVSLVEESGEEDGELRGVIRGGKGKMPGFKDKLSEQQITAIIQHLRSFSGGSRSERDDDR